MTAFAARFGRPPEAGARAPGRVNLIGEHTDYNDGLVLPFAIDRETFALAARRDDDRIVVWSANRDEASSFEVARLADERPSGPGHWSDYVKGVVFAFGERAGPVPGLDLAVASRVPIGAGLSSSAALTVSLATVLSLVLERPLTARERAEIAHRAESDYVGLGSGILDPFASALGQRDRALLLDCRSRAVRTIAMPPGRTCVLVADSGVRRSLADADSGYRRRVVECAAALAAAREARIAPPDARALRDLAPSDLPALEGRLAPHLFRRVRHVVSENERVRSCAAALEAGDLTAAGAIVRQGHRSLREDYEVSIPELDALCEIADALPGVHGSRLTGAGFGGCTLHLVDPEGSEEIASRLAAGFARRFDRSPPIVRIETADGAAPVDVTRRA